MITVLTGANQYALRQALRQLEAGFVGDVEKYDGTELTKESLLELAQGATLFSAERLIIIKDISSNKFLWPELDIALQNTASTNHLVLVDPGVDKRAKSYKWLQKNAAVQVFDEWTNRDEHTAIKWCENEARARGFALPGSLAQQVVRRAGPQQWRLAAAMEKLELMDDITSETIEQTIEPHLEENVFELFGAALSGDKKRVETMAKVLSQTDDAYRVFALISSQAVQLAALIVSDVPANDVAADIKASPYVLSKLAPYAAKKTSDDAAKLLSVLARADEQMKSTGVDPWMIVVSALLAV